MCYQCRRWGDMHRDPNCGQPLCERLRNLYTVLWNDSAPAVSPLRAHTLRTATERSGSGGGSGVAHPHVTVSPLCSTKQHQHEPSGPWQLNKEQVRVLLYRECDVRGRKLLYDSSTVVRVPVTENPSSPSCKTLFRQHRLSTSSSATLASSPSKCSGGVGAGQGVKVIPAPSPARPEHYAEISNGYGYQYRKQASDGKAVGELVFGSVALAYRGATSKVHLLQDPSRFVASRITLAPKSYRTSHGSSDQGLEDSWGSSMSSLGEAVFLRPESSTSATATPAYGISWPVEMPRILSSAHSEGDSGFVGPPSCSSSLCSSFLSPPSLPNTPMGTPSSRHGSGSSLNGSGSLNSLQRRFLRNVNTSLEALTKQQQQHQHTGSGGNYSSGGEEGSEDSGSYVPSQHVTRLGMAVIISTAAANGDPSSSQRMESWLLSHLGAVEDAINKLHMSLESAYLHRRSFVSSTHQAVVQFQQDMMDLVNGPRLIRPVWLSLLAKDCSERDNLCSSFVTTLTHILEHYDTKHTSFFVSKLITAVLTHHLGWVSTVAPTVTSTGETDTTAPANQATTPHWTESLSHSNPYNAVWAQLCELSGALGYPPKVARTVLLGSNKVLLLQFLTVLSYLIRCSEVTEQVPERPDLATTVLTSDEVSRTSSMTSIVTVLEGDRRDSSGRLRRDSSGKHINRRSSGLLVRECRFNDRPVCIPDRAEDRDYRTGEVSDERRRCRSGGDKSVLFCEQVLTQSTRESELKDDRSCPLEGESVDVFNRTFSHSGDASCLNKSVGLYNTQDCTKRDDSKKGFNKVKTAGNLLHMVKDGEVQDIELRPVQRLNVPQTPSESTSSESLYPTLHDMEDHRHTFGPISLEPDNIALKVGKLIRVPSDTTRASWSASRTPGAESGLSRTVGRFVIKETRKEVTVPSKSIEVEEEMGGKVLFLLGDNERLEGLKRGVDRSELKKGQHSESKKVNTLHLKHHPGDIRRREQVRNLGRESTETLAEVKLGSKYPSLHLLQQDLSRSASDPNCKSVMLGHVRRHSDPINGTHVLSKNPSLSLTLKQLKEEVAVEPGARTTEPNVSPVPSLVCDHGGIFSTVSSNTSPGTSSYIAEEERHTNKFSDRVSPLHGSVFYRSSSSGSGSSEGGNCFTEEAELISMPSLELSHDAKELSEDPAQRSPAWSALGGVLDHYSSAFLVHATTQTKNWEDALCHDLSVATHTHHPLLGHHLAEAVAVVADTESWDVQIVSSHTIVVERGSGAQVGLRVGMSPIVSSITDSLLHLAKLHVHPNFIVQHLEDRLRELYVKSQLLAEYLLAGSIGSSSGAFPSSTGVSSPYHLPALTHALGVDLNDLPLLLSVASTHTPALTRMFGLTFK